MSSFSQLLARRCDASGRLVLLIVSAGFALATLDLFVVNVALPRIAQDFGSSGLGDLSWVLNAYAIVYAALLVVFGRLADRFPREHGFLLGVAVFTMASALCATANSTLGLVIFRVVEAAGAALMTPISLGMVVATSSDETRERNVRVWTAIGGLTAGLGPVVGGLLVAISWRWVFVINIPSGLAVLAFGWTRLPHVPRERIPYPDALGAALITAGVALLTLGLIKGDVWGWGSTRTIGVLVGSVAAIGSFVVHCLRSRNPLLDRDLFRRRSFTGASVAATLYSVAFAALLPSPVLWFQNVWHWSALRSGLAIAPGPLLVLLTALLLTEHLIKRLGPGLVIAIGASLFAIGALWFALFAGLKPDCLADIFTGDVMIGVGVGLTLPTILASATSELSPQSSRPARRWSTCSVRSAWRSAWRSSSWCSERRVARFSAACLVAAGVAATGAIVTLLLLPAHPGAPTGASVPIDRRVALGDEA
jgi:EmrB/QacA subfamily drug resistance transporter